MENLQSNYIEGVMDYINVRTANERVVDGTFEISTSNTPARP